MASPLFSMIGKILGASPLCDTDAVLTTSSGAKPMRVHLAMREVLVEVDGGSIVTSQKTVWFPEASAADYRSSDEIVIAGLTYYLAAPVALGDGMVRSGLSTSI